MTDVVNGEVKIGGLARTFILRPPRGAPPDALVLVLHGNQPEAGGQQMREWASFDRQADAWGLAVAYPDGYQGSWADGRGVTRAEAAGVDDVAFLRAIIDWSADRYGTFPDRVIVAGMSNGACMAHRMALEASDQVAVLAAVSGQMPASLADTAPSHAVSAVLIHGTADSVAPITGGYSRHRGPNGELRGRVLSMDESGARWRAIDRCPAGPSETRATELSSRDTSQAGAGERGWSHGRCSAAGTPGRARPCHPNTTSRAAWSLTPPRRSAVSRGRCSLRPGSGGCDDPLRVPAASRAGPVPWPCSLAAAKADLGRGHRQIRQIAGGLSELAMCGGGQRGVKPRDQLVQCQPALREVLGQGRGCGVPVGVASAHAR
jgi:polyhydroxybutyrate depolymerase